MLVSICGPKDAYLPSTITFYNEDGSIDAEKTYTYFEDGAVSTYDYRYKAANGKDGHGYSNYRQFEDGISFMIEAGSNGYVNQEPDPPEVTADGKGNVAEIIFTKSKDIMRYEYYGNNKVSHYEHTTNDNRSELCVYDEEGKLIASSITAPWFGIIEREYSYSDSSEKDCKEVSVKTTVNGEVSYGRGRIQYEDGHIVAVWKFSDTLNDYYLCATYTYEKINNAAPFVTNVASILEGANGVQNI